MGQKVNPFGFRLGSLYTWKSKWYANNRDYSNVLLKDIKLREYLMETLKKAGILKVEIERSIKVLKIYIFVTRPGVVIGKGGSGIEKLNKDIKKLLDIKLKDKNAAKVDIRIEEVRKPFAHARLVAQQISDQLIRRYPHRRAVAQAMDKAMEAGVKGIKIQISGRIGGAEIARTEKYFKGNVPTQTLRADIDYAEMPSLTRSGYVGIKVWVHKGEKIKK